MISASQNISWLHPAYRRPMRTSIFIVAILTVCMVLAWALPPIPATRGIASYLPLHTLLETLSIVIAALVFSVGWNTNIGRLSGNNTLLACAFIGVGLLDFSHVLSFSGMPAFVTESSPGKSINFWLAARTLAAAALLWVAVTPWRPFHSGKTRYLLLAGVLALTAFTFWLFLFQSELVPLTFVPGKGLTPFKIGAEYFIIGLNVATAFALIFRMRKPQPFNAAALFGAVCVMALSEFFFTLYSNVTDIFNLLGHIYKDIAYLFIYRAIFVTAIEEPYKQLHASQSQMQATLDALPDLLFEVDKQGIYYAYHTPRHPLLRLPVENSTTRSIFENFPPNAVTQIMSALTEADQQGYSKGEYMQALSHGKQWFEFSVAKKISEAKQEPHFIVLLRDITERKLAEEKLANLNQELEKRVEERTAEMKAARDKAEEANAAKSEFLSSMSHELRTPMNAILGFSQLMEYDESLPDEQKDSVREILKAGRHLLTLINEVLDLSKIETGHIDLFMEEVEICPIFNECLSLVAPLAENRGIQITHSCLCDVWLQADRTRLMQVLLNLLSNAIKYNNENGRVTLEVIKHSPEHLRIMVSDTGPGIPEHRIKELFQPFSRLGAANSNIEGTGIGLTITQRIVEMMGGSVGVKSTLGQGSSFWIDMPCNFVRESDGVVRNTSAIDDATNVTSHQQHTLLYVEDNPANIRLLVQLLAKRRNIRLLTAHTPQLGIELAETHLPDLILLDINMPGMNGYQVLETIQRNPELKSTPVLALTANAMTHNIQQGLAAGFSDYLTKPLDLPRFFAILDQYLPAHVENRK